MFLRNTKVILNCTTLDARECDTWALDRTIIARDDMVYVFVLIQLCFICFA